MQILTFKPYYVSFLPMQLRHSRFIFNHTSKNIVWELFADICFIYRASVHITWKLSSPATAWKTLLCLNDYRDMKPAASSDPVALTPGDVEDLCNQIWFNPTQNATTIDDVKVQPSALKPVCDAMPNQTKSGDGLKLIFYNPTFSIHTYYQDKVHPTTYMNPCSKNMPDDYLQLLSENDIAPFDPVDSVVYIPHPTLPNISVTSGINASSLFDEQGSSTGETDETTETQTASFSSNGSDPEVNTTSTRKKRSDHERRKSIFELQKYIQRQLVDEYMRTVLEKVSVARTSTAFSQVFRVESLSML